MWRQGLCDHNRDCFRLRGQEAARSQRWPCSPSRRRRSRRGPDNARAPAQARSTPARALTHEAGRKASRSDRSPSRRGRLTVTGASLVEWAPAQAAFEVAQANPGLCAVLENAALLFASGQARCPRAQARGGHRERSRHQAVAAGVARAVRSPATPERPRGVRPARAAVRHAVRALGAGMGGVHGERRTGRARAGGYVAAGRQADCGRARRRSRVAARRRQARCTARGSISSSVIDFDDTGARLLANALAEARSAGLALAAQRAPRSWTRAGGRAVKRGATAGEGAWLLSLELLQWANDQRRRSRIAPSSLRWRSRCRRRRGSRPPAAVPAAAEEPAVGRRRDRISRPRCFRGPACLTGSLAPRRGKLADSVHGRDVVAVDMSGGRADRFRLRRRAPELDQSRSSRSARRCRSSARRRSSGRCCC